MVQKHVEIPFQELTDPNKLHDDIEIRAENRAELERYVYLMTLIRKAEERIADLVVAGDAKCPCHLGVGQEAAAVGVAAALTPSDRVFGTHRSHAHFLALGCDVHKLLAEVLGKATGASKGMGGSMHLWDGEHGFHGSVPIVGATISFAVGAGLSAKLMSKTGRDMPVGVCFFGDGATEEGTFHESMNLAASMKLPVLFVCENNLYSSHLHISERQPEGWLGRYAEAHGVNYATIDGNDVLSVRDATRSLLERARNGGGPAFIEAVTYRWRGHVGPSEDIDVGLKRKDNLTLWRQRDPIARLVRAMIARGDFTQCDWDNLDKKVDRLLDKSLEQAMRDPYPNSDAARSYLFS